MPGIRLTGLFDSAEGSNSQLIQQHTGYQLVREGRDWVIPENDPGLLAGPRPVLLFPPKPFELKSKNFAAIADRIFTEFLADDLESYLKPPPSKLSVPGGFGLASTLLETQYRYFFPQRAQLRKELIESIFPTMIREFNAKFVLPVKLDVSYQQALLSIPKIALLLKLFGKDEGARRIFDKDALKSLLPTADQVLGYLDGLLFVAPHTFAIPLNRPGSALYFLSKGAWVFPRTASENIFELLASDSEPAIETSIDGFFPSPGPNGHTMRAFLMCALDAINGLMRFLNDPRNFADASGEFNTQLNIQAQCSIRLMLADLLSMNFTGAFHVKHRLAFLFLDKYANLVCLYRGGIKNEVEYFKRLLSIDTGNKIATIIEGRTRVRNKRLSELLGGSVRLTYRRIHDHVTLRVDDPKVSEPQRLNHLRTLRNLGHGTNLHGQKFEETFIGGSPTIPSELVYVPLLIVLALGLETKKMLLEI